MLFIPMNKLKSGMKLSDNVLIFDNSSNVTLLKKDKVLTSQFINRLKRFEIPGVYVCDELTGNIMPSKPIINNKLKTKSLQNVEWVFQHSAEATVAQNQKYVEQLDKTVLEFINQIKANESTLVNIADLKSYDDYTYHHSLSVALLAISLGVEMHLTESELHKLGFAAIMHDIGKMSVPIELINKPSRLTDGEFAVVKQHSEFSGKYLMENHFNDHEVYQSVISHHEKCDGTGYPKKLKEKDIPFYAKIIAVSDVYDALTSHRPYRAPMHPSEVAEYIMANCGSAFDLDVVRAFLDKIEFYPIGSFVQLNTGQKAIVASNNANPLRPTVKLLEPPFEEYDLFDDSRYLNLIITKLYNDVPEAVLTELTKAT